MIVFQQVGKRYPDGTEAVRNLSMEIRDGETLVLLGSSGCGKTTTLKMINRLIEPTAGTITVQGEDILRKDPIQLRRSIGYVFQGIGLFPHMTVRGNIEVAPRLLGWPARRRHQRTDELLDLVGLDTEQFSDRYPDELSGGQKQRIGVARALATNPDILLMDEPFGALDAVTRDDLQKEVLSLKQRLNKTIVFVTHDILEALTLADRIAVLHEGDLEQIGTTEDIAERPATPFVRELFGRPAEQLGRFKELF